MPVQFILGRAGSGKTQVCLDGIAALCAADPLGPAAFWLVPRQATFQCERRLACGAGLPGFCRARVVSFESLNELVMAECGNTAVPEVSAAGRQMVLGHLLRREQPRLKFFASVARRTGLAAELDAAFSEIERSGKTVEELSQLLAEVAADGDIDAAALAKTADLHLLYEAYESYLGQDRLDPHRRMGQLLETVETCGLLRGATVYVDAFYDFSFFEREILARLAKAARALYLTLPIDPAAEVLENPHLNPADLSVFHRTEKAYRLLWHALVNRGVRVEPPVILERPWRFVNPSLGLLEKSLTAPRPPIYTGAPQHVTFVEAPDRRAEVDAVARQIRAWLADGLRLRDIGVIARGAEDYREVLDASFAEHGIPFFIDRRRSAMHHPLVQFARSAVAVALRDWPHDAAISLLKGGLAGASTDDADAVENYVLQHRIRGEGWRRPWDFRGAEPRGEPDDDRPAAAEEVERVEAVRFALVEGLSPVADALAGGGKVKVRDAASALCEAFETFGVRDALSGWIASATAAGDLQAAEEHAQVWAEVAKLLEQMVDLLGEEVVSPRDFADVLEYGLEQFDLAIIPPTVDQVLVGSADRTRTPPLRAVAVLGLNEGTFPLARHEASILSDAERRVFERHDLDLAPGGRRATLDEAFWGYQALTRAGERLMLTRPCSDEGGRKQNPSSLWERARALFPTVGITSVPRPSAEEISTVGTPRQLLTTLMDWARDGGKLDQPAAGLYDWFARHPADGGPVDLMRQRAWPALSYDNAAALSPAVAAGLFPQPLRTSVSRIETFAACPFQHFARYGLNLREREDQGQVTPMDLGNAYHRVLEGVVGRAVREKLDWAEKDGGADLGSTISTLAGQIGEQLRGEIMLSSGRNRYLLDRVEKTLREVVDAQRAVSGRGGFRPKYAELEFGTEGRGLGPFSLETPKGRTVSLRGQIDRVDVLEGGSAAVVVDYKLRQNQALKLDRAYHGLSLQLLTYLLVLQSNGTNLADQSTALKPAAAFYVRLLREVKKIKDPAEAVEINDPLFRLRQKPRGVFDDSFADALDANQKPGSRSEVIFHYIKKDECIGSDTDSLPSAEFAALVGWVGRRIGELVDRLLDGEIGVRPYRIGTETPCPRCDYRSVCRFDPSTDRYRFLEPMRADEVLVQIGAK